MKPRIFIFAVSNEFSSIRQILRDALTRGGCDVELQPDFPLTTNRLAEAEPLMRRALAIDEQSYGSEHSSVAVDLNNLAQLFTATNRLAKAEPLMRRSLKITFKSLGSTHPDTINARKNYRLLLKRIGIPKSTIEQRLKHAMR